MTGNDTRECEMAGTGAKSREAGFVMPMCFSVMLSILAILVPLLLALSATTYFYAKEDLERNQERLRRQGEAGITSTLAKIEGGYLLVQKALEKDLGPVFAEFAHMVDAARGEYEHLNLGLLKSRFGKNYEFYIANASTGVIEYATLESDIGLNLSMFREYWTNLQMRLRPGQIVSGPVSVEYRSGNLRHYAYLLLPDGDYFLEIGLLAEGFSKLVERQNFYGMINEFKSINPTLMDVRIFDYYGYLDKDPERKRAEEPVLGHVNKAFRDKADVEVLDRENNTLTRYLFVDLSEPASWPVYKVVELTYSTDTMRETLHKHTRTQFAIGLVFVALGVLLSMLMASRISKPVKGIIDDVDRIAGGDIDHTIEVKSHNELRILEQSINTMVRSMTQSMHRVECVEQEISLRNQELEKTNQELVREIRDRERMERDLRQSELILRVFLDAIPDSAILIDPDGRIVDINNTACQRIGKSREGMVGSLIYEHITWEVFEQRHDRVYDAICRKEPVVYEDTYSGRFYFTIAAPICNTSGDVEYVVLYLSDITDRKQAEEKILRQQAHFQQLFENAPLAIAIYDRQGGIRRVNKALEKLYRYTEEELLGRSLDDIIVPLPQEQEIKDIRDKLSEGQSAALESVRKRKDGRLVNVAILCFPVLIDGRPEGAYLIYQDITERKRAEEQLVFQSFHDTLTGFPNRALLLDRLQRSIQRLRQRRFPLFAVLYLDLDRFKVVNDSLGHQVGDQLIYNISRKLAAMVNSTDTVSRIGGDEFAVLLDEVDSPRQALNVARSIQDILSKPMVINNHEIFSTASIGIVVGTPEYNRPEMLLRDAEIAMYRAKTMGRNRVKLFQSGMREQAAEILRVENDLRRAVDNREFVVHYQPIISLDTGLISGFEALIRWQHPSRGLVFPDEFVPVAEESGLIIPIGLLALGDACRQVRQWQKRYSDYKDLEISVNLSAKQFLQSDLIEQISGTAQEAGLQMQHLKLEITESVVMENAQSARIMLHRLKDLNVKLSIDDFGTGYSSLAYLHQFPLDTLKIDRSFVARMDDEGEDVEIVRAIVVLAHNLGMEVVAEGVETQEQEQRLKSMNCDYFQGYLASRPLDGVGAEELLRASPHWWC